MTQGRRMSGGGAGSLGFNVDLEGRLSVVVGGNQGIGAAIAKALADSGSDLVLLGRDREKLAASSDEIRSLTNATVTTRVVDIVDVKSVQQTAEDLVRNLGAPTVLVNAAGGKLRKQAFGVTQSEWDSLMNTHLRGTFFVSQAFGRSMAKVGYGKIINLSSTWASTTAPDRVVYCTAKAGVSHMTSSLGVEWARHGIRVNAIAPTATRTPRVMERIAADPHGESFATARIPLGRLAEPEDIVGAALFLASSASDFVTGHTIYVDGGWRTAK